MIIKRRSILTSILLFSLSVSTITACGNSAPEIKTPTTAPKADAVKIGALSVWAGYVPWEVAQAKNIFQDNKVDVDLQWYRDLPTVAGSLNAGKLDASTQTLGETITGIANGADLVVVLTNDYSTDADKIIVSDKIKSIKDLKGKKVAVEPGSVDHFFLAQALKRAGMTFKDIQLVKLESSKAAAAFVAGEVEATATYAPFTTVASKRPGSSELFTGASFPGTISDHLIFTRKFVNQHPEKVQSIVDSWFDTLAYIDNSKNRAEAIDLMAKRAGASVADYKDDAKGIKILSVEENIAAFGTEYGDTSAANIAKEMSAFLFENGITKTKVDTSKLFDDRFVKAYAAKKKAK